LIRNPVRVGALENLYRCIHTCDDQEIVILLDGDDWLAHPRVLQTLNADLQEARALLEERA
jgi:hypothetical protein